MTGSRPFERKKRQVAGKQGAGLHGRQHEEPAQVGPLQGDSDRSKAMSTVDIPVLRTGLWRTSFYLLRFDTHRVVVARLGSISTLWMWVLFILYLYVLHRVIRAASAQAQEMATWSSEDLLNHHHTNFQVSYDAIVRVVIGSYGLLTFFTDRSVHKFTLMEKRNLKQYGQALQPLLANKLKTT